MRFRYSVLNALQPEWESQPRVPLFLFTKEGSCETLGLVDSGAMMNILPYQVGLMLGAVWDDLQATVRLGGVVTRQNGIPLTVMGKVGNLPPVKLVFAWVKTMIFLWCSARLTFL